jgi:hypothetical protein
MRQSLYTPAQAIAGRVRAHFERHVAQAKGVEDLAAVPDVEAIEAMIDAAFWASLRRQEGYVPTITLAFAAPAPARRPLRFEAPLPLTTEALTRLAPAVERPGIHLGVSRDGGELAVWGMTHTLPAFCFVVEVAAPGLLVIKHRRREESAKFVNVAVLEGDEVKMLDETAARLPDCPSLVPSLFGFESQGPAAEGSVNVLSALAVSMRSHGHGGTLLVVPQGTDTWRESIVPPILYTATPSYDDLARLMDAGEAARGHERWQDSFRRAIDAIAGLTAVDGAAVMSDSYEVLAFGVKIGRREGAGRVEHVIVTEPVEGRPAATMNPAQLGGTRHSSAAQFVHDQRDALALVASQDGRFTIFAWSPCEGLVHGHRVEALLL